MATDLLDAKADMKIPHLLGKFDVLYPTLVSYLNHTDPVKIEIKKMGGQVLQLSKTYFYHDCFTGECNSASDLRTFDLKYW